MQVIFKNIPNHINGSTLAKLITPLLEGTLWFKSGRLLSVEQIVVTNQNKSFAEHHYLAIIEPDVVAHRVIKKLNGIQVLHHRLSVSEFVQRNWKNDPRLSVPEIPLTESDDRRIFDRRIKGQVIKKHGC